jgi:hypothetical protein
VRAAGGESSASYEPVLSWKGQVSRFFGQSKKRLFATLSPEEQSALEDMALADFAAAEGLAVETEGESSDDSGGEEKTTKSMGPETETQ